MYRSERVFAFPLPAGKNLIANSFMGTSFLVPDDYYAVFKDPENSSLPNYAKASRFFLKTRTFFESQEAESDELLRRLNAFEAETVDSPAQFTFVPGFTCNFACPYCCEEQAMKEKKVFMTPAQVKLCFGAIDEIQNLLGAKPCKQMDAIGGETLLPMHLPTVSEILKQCRTRGIRLRIVSNGYFLDRYIAVFKRYRSAIQFLEITLDGIEEVHNCTRKLRGPGNSFQKIVSNLDLAIKAGVPIVVRTNFDRKNSGKNLEKYIAMIREKKWHKKKNVSFKAHPVLLPWTLDSFQTKESDPSGLFTLREFIQELYPHSKLKDPKDGIFDLYSHVSNALDDLLAGKRGRVPLRNPCVTRKNFYFAGDGNIYPCIDQMHVPSTAVGRYDPEFQMDPSRGSFGFSDARSIEKRFGCDSCKLRLVCAGPCPLMASELRPGEPAKCYVKEGLSPTGYFDITSERLAPLNRLSITSSRIE